MISDTKNELDQDKHNENLMREKKKLKIKLSIIKDPINSSLSNNSTSDCNSSTNSNSSNLEKKLLKKNKDNKIKHRKIKDGNYQCGRWQQDEHQRFIEAILNYGNEWKQVQKHVGTRSSTQARSHAQKFFVKIKKSNLFDFNIDFSKNSMKALHSLAHNLDQDDYQSAIKALNCIAFERKSLSQKRKKKDEHTSNDSFINDFTTTINSNINMK
jgi:SHAQKYF class myb-like DNA-binding protein